MRARGETNWLEPLLICANGGSNDPGDDDKTHECVEGSIFGRIIEVSATGTTKTVNGNERTTISYNFDRNVAPWSQLVDDLAAFGLSDEEIEKVATHDDLLKRFAPFRLDPSEYSNNDEYVQAVLKKQIEHINGHQGFNVRLPEEYEANSGGSRSTGGPPLAS